MDSLKKNLRLILFLLLVTAFAFRAWELSFSLSEDEAHKIAAAERYRLGDFTVNGEHPMLMKLLITASLSGFGFWNQTVDHRWPMLHAPEEIAVRFPNLVFGSLTTLGMFLLGRSLFSLEVGLLSAVFWAVGVNVIAFNRIAKEDSLMVFFFVMAFYFYDHGKTAEGLREAQREKYYLLSAACLGLQLASKYFIHYWGLMMFSYYVMGKEGLDRRPVPGRTWLKFYVTYALVFIVANPIILSPANFRYLLQYVGEKTMTHHGYLMMGQLYLNSPSTTPFGTPAYFYLLFLAVKTPVVYFIAFLIGLWFVLAERQVRGHVFLRIMLLFWLVPYSLVGGKWLRYTLTLMPFAYLTAAVGTMRILGWLKSLYQRLGVQPARYATATIVLAFIVYPTAISVTAAPYYSLYVNPLGGGKVHAGYFFPHDEFYDLGLREAAEFVMRSAPPGAKLASEAPFVIDFYRTRYGCRDLKLEVLSDPRYVVRLGSGDYVFIQDGRRYFENNAVIHFIEAQRKPIKVIDVRGANAVRVYRL